MLVLIIFCIALSIAVISIRKKITPIPGTIVGSAESADASTSTASLGTADLFTPERLF